LPYCRQGHAQQDLNHPDEAKEAFSRAKELDPANAQGWAGLGGLLGQVGKLDIALSNLSKAVDLKPDYVAAWLNKSTIEKHLGISMRR
jgi:tetratricopeptide (TPR) repeat protein